MCRLPKSAWVILISLGVGLWTQFVRKGYLCTSETDLSGRTAIVSGGNSGIGFESALGLAQRNARVIIACRNEQKAQIAVENIRKYSGKSAIDYMIVDFADVADIRRAVREFLEVEERLDILVNNAGTVSPGKTKDGFDMMFGVNHIGYFVFTNLLMPLMRKTSKISPVRIINVSSVGYVAGRIDFNNLNPEITMNSGFVETLVQYFNTKLMNIYFTRELDARLKKEFEGQEQAITTYSLHPGEIQTNLGRNMSEGHSILSQCVRYFFINVVAKPAVYGAQTTLYCCLEEGIEKYSGNYFQSLKHTQLFSHALDPEIGKKLWEVTEELSGVHWEN